MSWYEVTPVSQLKDNEMKAVEVSGRRISVVKVGGDFFAFDDTCTHHQCSLSEGFIEGTTVECPCHGALFDVKSGQVLRLPATQSINTYPVKVENEIVFVEL
jgi:nitrite reductase/ring-hydroxylating ferredoxin subunit